jgi:hypothetical protein
MLFSKELRLQNALTMRSMIIIGDSSIIIQFINNNKTLNDDNIPRLITRIEKELFWFEETQFFYILRSLSKEADKNANVTTRLEESMIRKNGVGEFHVIPCLKSLICFAW